MDELDRYLEANKDLLEKSFSSSSFSQSKPLQRQSQSSFQPLHSYSPSSSRQKNSAVRHTQNSQARHSPKKESILQTKMISKPSNLSQRRQQSHQKIAYLSTKIEFMKLEFDFSIDQFLNSYLEEWRTRRKLQLR